MYAQPTAGHGSATTAILKMEEIFSTGCASPGLIRVLDERHRLPFWQQSNGSGIRGIKIFIQIDDSKILAAFLEDPSERW